MIPESRLFIKAGLIYLVGAMLLLLIDSLPGVATGVRLLPLYWHMIVVGWITQVIIGVSLWMFPARDKSQRGKPPPLGRTLFVLLNTGLVLRLLFEPFADAGRPTIWVGSGLILSILLQSSAMLLYAVIIWPRVQPKRERKGSRKRGNTSKDGSRTASGNATGKVTQNASDSALGKDKRDVSGKESRSASGKVTRDASGNAYGKDTPDASGSATRPSSEHASDTEKGASDAGR